MKYEVGDLIKVPANGNIALVVSLSDYRGHYVLLWFKAGKSSNIKGYEHRLVRHTDPSTVLLS